MAMMLRVGQFGVIRPVSAYWPSCLDITNQLKQDFAHLDGQLLLLLPRPSGEFYYPLHNIYQLLDFCWVALRLTQPTNLP